LRTSNTQLRQLASLNNALWCDTVCRSHGLKTRMTDKAWMCNDTPPPFYPRFVTLSEHPETLSELDTFRSSLFSNNNTEINWAIKDSFDVLSLGDHGFVRLFDANWYICAAQSLTRIGGDSVTVDNETSLEKWIEVWAPTSLERPIFLPSLLQEDPVIIVSTPDFAGGLIVYRTLVEGLDIVGVSNLFGSVKSQVICMGHIADLYPNSWLIGYGDMEEINGLSEYGFTTLGPLSVWVNG
jgi:hypothetical protein